MAKDITHALVATVVLGAFASEAGSVSALFELTKLEVYGFAYATGTLLLTASDLGRSGARAMRRTQPTEKTTPKT